jgi:signal transduction histidine kinase
MTAKHKILDGMPFSRKLALAIIICSLSLGTMVFGLSVFLSAKMHKQSRLQQYEVMAVLLGQILSDKNNAEMQSALEAFGLDRDFKEVCVYASVSANSPLLSYSAVADEASCDQDYKVAKNAVSDRHAFSIVTNTESFDVVFYFDNRYASDYLQSICWIFLSLLMCGIVAVLLFSSLAARLLLAPVNSLLAVMQEVRSNGDYRLRSESPADDEFAILSENFNAMIADIDARNQQLISARHELELRVCEVDVSNRELSDALANLKQTQQRLINIEKMASLGTLVAGVAHEINTPIGVSVTAASTLQANTNIVQESYHKGELTQTALQEYWQKAISSSGMILSNMQRAAELIRSFKRVAVDQSSSEIQKFDLKDYLQQVLLSLKPQLDKVGLGCRVDCDEGLILCSYPGAISQVVTNLVMNAITHAYEGRDTGIMALVVERSEDNISLVFSDDGCGIGAENLSRVFDPFFTTKRGSGGSGLGLHIVYNLVTQQLCGEIKVESIEGQGSIFSLLIPSDVSKVKRYGSI